MRTRTLAMIGVLLAQLGSAYAEPASTKPPTWTTGRKQGIGTALDRRSRVWFSLADGTLTEVYYPRIDTAQLRRLELTLDGRRESEVAEHAALLLDPQALVYRQTNRAKDGRWRVEKTYATLPDRDALVVDIAVFASKEAVRVGVAMDPALANGTLHDRAKVEGRAVVAWEKDVALALEAEPPLAGASVAMADGVARATAELGKALAGRPLRVRLALGFGATDRVARDAAAHALARPFEAVQRAYADTWHRYLAPLWAPSDPWLAARYRVALMVLRAHEDKTYPGAMIASLSIPWGNGVDARSATAGGYHLVWARDLYQVATALDAAGDHATAERALDYLLGVQQRADGSWPQNSWLDGRPYFGSLQLDEVAYPIILAYELGRRDTLTYERLKRAAEFIVAHGPASPQERWEEEGGYSPSTIAAEIAALVCMAELAKQRGDAAAPRYLALADAWQRDIEKWTVARGGPLGDHYVRVAQKGVPGGPLEVNNGGGTWDEREVVDAGFLELVRLGVKRYDDPLIVKSLALVDRMLRVETPFGPGFYRYNHDGYGDRDDGGPWQGSGRGRLWPLLTGERGEYLVAAHQDARPYLKALASFASQGLLIAEQVWDQKEPAGGLRFGEGTGSATPLAWSMAELVRLTRSIELGRVVGQPALVVERYARPAQRTVTGK